MGMLLGHHETSASEDVLTIESEPLENDVEDTGYEASGRVPLNTGIGIVLPIQYVIEAIEQPEIMERRMAALKDASRKTGFVADSAVESAQSTTDENLQHAEDFNRLLTSAATGKIRDDQT